MQTSEQPMTVEAFDALPESVLPHQYIRGHLIVSPPPNRLHQRLTGEIFVEISLFLRAHPDLGEVYQAPFEVRLKGPEGEERYQPDVMFFAGAHLNRLTDQCAVGVPDLVVEVLSPKTARYDRNEKRLSYAQNGVAELWIIDPKRKAAEVYRFAEGVGRPPKVLKSSDVLSTGLLPGFELALNRLFG